MKTPRWCGRLLTHLCEPGRVDEMVGDLEEAHRRRLGRHSRPVAYGLTAIETLDMAWALLKRRRRAPRPDPRRPGGRFSGISWLDVKLGLRMVLRYPWLSAVSVLGMAVAVTIGASTFGAIRAVTASPLPLDEPDRVVRLQNVVGLGFDLAARTHLHALDLWRSGLPALDEVGAFRIVTRNLITRDGRVAPGRVAEMTASGFRIARVPPLLGRYLVDADEQAGAPHVVVIGHGVWQDRFGGDPQVLGRTLQVGATPHQVVGVMPRGFAFPLNDRVWAPLRLDPGNFAPGSAPEIEIFARLAPGTTMEVAREQVQGVSQRVVEESGRGAARVEARVHPYTQQGFWGPMSWFLYVVQALVSMILVVIAINVAALVYARTVARSGEIAVRSALGASRTRIVAQLFAEAFVLSVAAAVAGLLAASFALDRIGLSMLAREGVPFWWDFGLSKETVAYALGLSVVAAVIIGVVPALGGTGRRLFTNLQKVGAGVSGPRLGRTWTALIVLQVAAAVSILPVTLSSVARFLRSDVVGGPPLPLDEVLIAKLELDWGADEEAAEDPQAAWQAHYDRVRDELARRLEARPEVAGLAYMGTPPWLDPDLRFEIDGPSVAPRTGTTLGSASSGHALGRSVVGPELFGVVDVPVISGRLPGRADAVEGATSIVVNERFEELVLGGGSALGRRVRFPRLRDPGLGNRSELDGTGEPWYTIVGVVPSFPPRSGIANPEAKAYLPLLPGHRGPLHLAMRIRSEDAGRFAGPLRRIVADVDPMLRLSGVETLEAMRARANSGAPTVLITIVGLASAVLLLAVAGLYALVSFTVAQRRREIGVRIALGARSSRVLGAILAAAARRLVVGVLAGLAFAGVIDRLLGGEMLGRQEALVLPAVALLMAVVGLMAAWAPAREGLSIQPTEALRAD